MGLLKTLLLGSLLILFSAGIIFSLVLPSTLNSDDRKDICKNQCELRNESLYKYNIGGYQNPSCLCINNAGMIETIYTE